MSDLGRAGRPADFRKKRMSSQSRFLASENVGDDVLEPSAATPRFEGHAKLCHDRPLMVCVIN